MDRNLKAFQWPKQLFDCIGQRQRHRRERQQRRNEDDQDEAHKDEGAVDHPERSDADRSQFQVCFPAPCEEDLQQHREQDQPNQRLHTVQKDRQFDVGQDDAQKCEQCHDQIGLPVIGQENDEDEIESSDQLRSRIQSMNQRVALDIAPEQ